MAKKEKLSKEDLSAIKNITPPPADRDKSVSFLQTIFAYTNVHGFVAGVIQQININQVQETTVFFSDGFTFTSDIPLIGLPLEEYRWNLKAMKSLIAQIPNISSDIEGSYIVHRGTPEELKEPQSYGMTCYFVFRPEETIVDVSQCIGIWTLDNAIQTIATDPYSEFMPETGAEAPNEA